jgi:hypothetical protein
MARKKIHHVLILDRSGSMHDSADPGSKQTKATVAMAGIKHYVEEQQGEDVLFTAWEFDGRSTDKIADQVPSFTWACVPRGGTPLLDAVGTIITSESERLKNAKRVFVVIATDGEENSSREWKKPALGKLIERVTEDMDWDVVFIGADFDAFAEAGGIGISRGSTLVTNTANPGAYMDSFLVTSSAVRRAAAGGQSVSYTSDERTQAAEGTGE